MKEAEYIVYKGDKVIGVGTAKELAAQFHVKRQRIRVIASKCFKRFAEESRAKGNGNRIEAYRIED